MLFGLGAKVDFLEVSFQDVSNVLENIVLVEDLYLQREEKRYKLSK